MPPASPGRSPHTQKHTFQTALQEPAERCRSLHTSELKKIMKASTKEYLATLKLQVGKSVRKQWDHSSSSFSDKIHLLCTMKKIHFFTGTYTKNINICTAHIQFVNEDLEVLNFKEPQVETRQVSCYNNFSLPAFSAQS